MPLFIHQWTFNGLSCDISHGIISWISLIAIATVTISQENTETFHHEEQTGHTAAIFRVHLQCSVTGYDGPKGFTIVGEYSFSSNCVAGPI